MQLTAKAIPWKSIQSFQDRISPFSKTILIYKLTERFRGSNADFMSANLVNAGY